AARDLEVVGIDEAVDKAAALLRVRRVVNDRRNVAHVGVDRKADHEKLHRRYEDGEEEGHRVAADVNRLLAQHGDQAGEGIVASGADPPLRLRFRFFRSQGFHNYSLNALVNVTKTSSSDAVIVFSSTSVNPSRARSDLTWSSVTASSISR